MPRNTESDRTSTKIDDVHVRECVGLWVVEGEYAVSLGQIAPMRMQVWIQTSTRPRFSYVRRSSSACWTTGLQEVYLLVPFASSLISSIC